jgi:hypothetical protein
MCKRKCRISVFLGVTCIIPGNAVLRPFKQPGPTRQFAIFFLFIYFFFFLGGAGVKNPVFKKEMKNRLTD